MLLFIKFNVWQQARIARHFATKSQNGSHILLRGFPLRALQLAATREPEETTRWQNWPGRACSDLGDTHTHSHTLISCSTPARRKRGTQTTAQRRVGLLRLHARESACDRLTKRTPIPMRR
ncbi:hypothetical protein BV898_19771 [Hypsibius exemplaris]|uniref:Uncharacterized protein n=1 Tax=Hypsibius exemplaris TaxID=2072580 RepID=A0A9X6RPR3_HYPEX|nr:hypothetical protein BV898_19771 [Hypsibius exemplaris]